MNTNRSLIYVYPYFENSNSQLLLEVRTLEIKEMLCNYNKYNVFYMNKQRKKIKNSVLPLLLLFLGY